MKTDHRLLMEGRFNDLCEQLAEVETFTDVFDDHTRNTLEQLVTYIAVAAERTAILDKLIKESTDQDWQE